MMFKNTVLPVQTTLQSKGRLLDISTPVIMGILNATPDSFYNKGRESDADSILRNAERMLSEGAAILDVGGASTKPGSGIIAPDEELRRVLPVLEALHRRFPDAWLSVDTYHSRVAKEAVAAGASIINDVSSGSIDSDMIATVAKLQVPYIAMHMQGTPATMQQNPQYNNVTQDILNYLRTTIDTCEAAGIKDIIIDPGFGFGKTLEHNYELLRNMHTLRMLGKPILAGISRKGMVWKALGTTPDEALNGTTALHMIALQQGANILRVHDVKEATEVVTLLRYLHC
ncbi:dihydropteroate synthase [Chitinophagaceae bacterium IBVUCB1]|nr:dihydropteroate synthase [Chitinophagaceae bacterium IBVUCB1]